MRKIIQIAASPADDGADLFSLCNDGTVFALYSRGWTEMPAIPQPDPKTPESKLFYIDCYANELMGGGDEEVSHESRSIGSQLKSMLSGKD